MRRETKKIRRQDMRQKQKGRLDAGHKNGGMRCKMDKNGETRRKTKRMGRGGAR